ncbi:MAG TPA: hypothetical protein V6C58_02910 [Allocoleopsis sp.]
MTQTLEQIQKVIKLLNDWGLTKDLTAHELEMLEIELTRIGGVAIMESQNAIQNILPDLYRQLTK